MEPINDAEQQVRNQPRPGSYADIVAGLRPHFGILSGLIAFAILGSIFLLIFLSVFASIGFLSKMVYSAVKLGWDIAGSALSMLW